MPSRLSQIPLLFAVIWGYLPCHLCTCPLQLLENSSVSASTLQGPLAAGRMLVAPGCVSQPSQGTTSKYPPSWDWEPQVDGRSASGHWPDPLGTCPCQKVIRTPRSAVFHAGCLGCFLMEGQTLHYYVHDGSGNK